ncbi:hypothetical protein F0562_003107 [Nyssa sinensis]|uniref:Aldehyde dehydrogenase domain-containing protein n=1 Tax=Nyssa sinensis TaxID=561372 RepID=A0A5J5BYE9_9ASTE|nr:hypothetical protein F0562_003107 [Nyssa sinensis]
MTKLVTGVLESNNLPGAIFTSFCGGAEIGQAIAKDTRIPLVSFTRSSKGGKILIGGSVIESEGNFMQPTIVEISPTADVVKEELFGPVLYVMKFQTLKEAIVSSSIFTRKPEVIFKWIGPQGSDCGIVNVNIPTNGVEIGGAFGGEKATGGGREAGSDSWKQYWHVKYRTVQYL